MICTFLEAIERCGFYLKLFLKKLCKSCLIVVTLVKAIVRFSFGENFRNVESHGFFWWGGGGEKGEVLGELRKIPILVT